MSSPLPARAFRNEHQRLAAAARSSRARALMSFGSLALGLTTSLVPFARIDLNGFFLPAPPQLVVYRHSFALLSVPFGWIWLAITLALAIASLTIPRARLLWLAALVCAAGLAGCIQSASLAGFSNYRVIPTETFHSDCGANLPLTGPAGLKRGCIGPAIGHPLNDFFEQTAAGHPQLTGLGGYRLAPLAGWWLFSAATRRWFSQAVIFCSAHDYPVQAHWPRRPSPVSAWSQSGSCTSSH